MPTRYIPQSEADKLFWLQNLSTKLPTYGASLGLAPAEMADLSAKTVTATSSKTSADAAQAEARGAVQTKRLTIADAEQFARSLVSRIQPHPSMTDAIRAELLITIRDTDPTPTSDDVIMTIEPPLVRLDWSVRRQVTIHWGPNPGDERSNGRPEGTVGAMLEWARGGIPTNESSWSPIEIDTDSPYIHVLSETAPIALAYRARYVSKQMKFGPPSDPVVCTLTP